MPSLSRAGDGSETSAVHAARDAVDQGVDQRSVIDEAPVLEPTSPSHVAMGAAALRLVLVARPAHHGRRSGTPADRNARPHTSRGLSSCFLEPRTRNLRMQLTAPASPALRLAQQLAWMRDNENTPVVELIPTAPDTLEVVVRDGWFEGDKTGDDADYYRESAEQAADHAAKWLKPVVDGVKLIARTEHGYVGTAPAYPGWDEEMFLNGGMPGYAGQYGSYEKDLDGDGAIEPNEHVQVVPVASEADKARWQHVLTETYGSPEEYGPVEFEVESN
jgi:hypothetical protein